MARKQDEITRILGELCDAKGPRLTIDQIVTHLDRHGCFDLDAKLVAFAKKIKAREHLKKLTFVDETTGLKLKRLWSFRDNSTGRRGYADFLDMSPELRKKLVAKYVELTDMLAETRRESNEKFRESD